MLFLGALLALGLWVFCVVDVVTAADADVRHLPKPAWLLLVLVFPVAGSLAWLIAGRPLRPGRGDPWRPRARPAPAPPTPESAAEFRRRFRARAEEQRRKAGGEPPA